MNKLISIGCIMLLAGCNSASSPSHQPIVEHPLSGYYHEFDIALGEGDDMKVQAVMSFRKGDEFGKKEILPGFQIYVDTTEIPADPEFNNYSTELNPQGFEGIHTLKVTQAGAATIGFTFEFKKFNVTSALPAVINNESFIAKKAPAISIGGLPDGDSIIVRFFNADLDNEKNWFTYVIKDGMISLNAQDIKSLQPGTYKLRLDWTRIYPVLIHKKDAGKLDVTYLTKETEVKVNTK